MRALIILFVLIILTPQSYSQIGPSLIFDYDPAYPANFNGEKRHDTLYIKSLIDEQGYVKTVRIEKSTGNNILDSVAVEAAYDFVYEPSHPNPKEDKSINAWTSTIVIFDTLLTLEENKVLPKIIEFIKPVYPRLAWQAGIDGTTAIDALIDTVGNIITFKFNKKSGTQSLDEAAVESLVKCKFSPGLIEGEKAEMWLTFRIHFTNNHIPEHRSFPTSETIKINK